MGMTFSDLRCLPLISADDPKNLKICPVCGNPFRVTCRESEWSHKISVRVSKTKTKLVPVCSYHCMMALEKAACEEEPKPKIFDHGALLKIMGIQDLTGRQLSDRTGIPYSSIMNYMSKQKHPSPARVVQIAAALGVEPEELLESED